MSVNLNELKDKIDGLQLILNLKLMEMVECIMQRRTMRVRKISVDKFVMPKNVELSMVNGK